ncbi:tripartite tricarboxylate transporter TctB family protein [Nocardioides sediminis]|uniref:tripartite tricarboxylate transporter TctB family protein n=1 Tax=Nocardioides sediminis TaxID=433648 RepID=UPI000D3031F3|nr:tripartite tricarboxylate transporter TctB family protein [Nocardioides sediminis]
MSTTPAAPGDHAGRLGGRSGPSLPDLMAGATFVVLGLAFAIGGSQYDVGTALRMGSGYVPIALGGILTVLGLVIVVASFRGVDPTVANADRGPIPWQRMGLLVGAILFFGFTVGGLGLGPSLLVTTFLAALAGHGTRPGRALVIAIGLTALCLVVFVSLLQLRLPILGDWLGG